MSLTFGALIQKVARNVQIPGANKYATVQIQDYLQQIYSDLWYQEEWPDTLDYINFTQKAGQQEFTLPKTASWLIRLYTGDFGDQIRILDVASYADNIFILIPFQTTIGCICPIRTASVTQQPATPPARLNVVSTNTGDVGTVFLKGQDANGDWLAETVTLNGLTQVQTNNLYTSVLIFSKNDLTLGSIQLYDADGATLLGTIGKYENRPIYQTYRTDGKPSQDTVYNAIAKKPFVPLLNSYDVPIWEMDNVLIYGATSLSWSEQRQTQKALEWQQRYQAAVANMKVQLLNETGQTRILAPSARA